MFKCFACGERGKFADLVDSYAELSDNDELRELALQLLESDKPSLLSTLAALRPDLDDWVHDVAAEKPRALNPELMSYDRFPEVSAYVRAYDYLTHTREMDPDLIGRFDLRYDPRQNRVV